MSVLSVSLCLSVSWLLQRESAASADRLKPHSYAQKNLADEIALDELVQEVQDLRKVVQERQESLRPKVEQVHMALQEDPRAPVIEMMQQAAGDAESACREIIDAGGGGGNVTQSRTKTSSGAQPHPLLM